MLSFVFSTKIRLSFQYYSNQIGKLLAEIARIEAAAELNPVAPKRGLAHAGEESHQTEEAHLVVRIEEESQERQHVLHMELLEHAHAARDAEWKTTARERHLDVDRGVVRTVEYGNVTVQK